jgi:UDP-glucose 4-epimerase
MDKVLNPYAGEKILVTGATGFIGSALCRRLSRVDAEIHVVSRREPEVSQRDLRWWQGDLADTVWVNQLLCEIKPNLIFHLASEVTGDRRVDLVIPALRANLVSTVNLLTTASELGCCRRMILAGSFEEPERGDLEAVPCSPYAAAKSAASSYARMFQALYGFPVVIARIFMVYGPGQGNRFLIPYVIDSFARGEPPKLSSGNRLVDWIYVEDVVEALLQISLSRGIDGDTIDIGSGTLVSIRNVVELLSKILKPNVNPIFGALPDRPLEPTRMADIAKSRAAIDWLPTTSLQEGLERTVGWSESLAEGSISATQGAGCVEESGAGTRS